MIKLFFFEKYKLNFFIIFGHYFADEAKNIAKITSFGF
jgi:hypothetical protein